MSFGLVVEKSDTAVPLDLTIDQDGVGGVTGKSPTVAIRKGSTANQYLDFGDNTFKTSGWTTKYASMTEIERGHYRRALDASLVVGLTGGTVLVAEYHVDDGGTVKGDAHDDILVVNEIYDLPSEITVGSDVVDAILDAVVNGSNHFTSGSVGEALTLIRGLVQQNFVLDSTSYNGSGLLTSGRIRIFDTALAVASATDGGSGEGEIASFSISGVAELANPAQVRLYKVARI